MVAGYSLCCALLIWSAIGLLGALANAQMLSPPSRAEIEEQVAHFKDAAFTKCANAGDEGPLPESPGDFYYYAGPFALDGADAACRFKSGKPVSDCRMIVEYHTKNAAPFKPSDKPLSNADRMNLIQWNGITFDYSSSRQRYMADGTWLPWSPWQDHQGPELVALLSKKNGQWLAFDLRMTDQMLSASSLPGPGQELGSAVDSLGQNAAVYKEQLAMARGPSAPLDGLLASMPHLSCSTVFANPKPTLSGNAVTTGRVPDPDPQAPADCALPPDTWVSIQIDMPLLGKAKVYVLHSPNGPRSPECSNPLTIDRNDIRTVRTIPRVRTQPLGAKDDLPEASAQPHNRVTAGHSSPGQPFTVVRIPQAQATVGPSGLRLQSIPEQGRPVSFTVPAGTVVIVDAKTPDGWLHVVAKPSEGHWTPDPAFYGWARPGSLPIP